MLYWRYFVFLRVRYGRVLQCLCMFVDPFTFVERGRFEPRVNLCSFFFHIFLFSTNASPREMTDPRREIAQHPIRYHSCFYQPHPLHSCTNTFTVTPYCFSPSTPRPKEGLVWAPHSEPPLPGSGVPSFVALRAMNF